MGDVPDASAQAVFQQQWRIYRTLIDHNYLFHREVYSCLRRILTGEAPQPFRFLDVACGDATEIVGALDGTPIARYHGIDLSSAALELADRALAALGCPVTLEQRDFIDAVNEQPEPADVVWIGLCLHHLLTPEKLAAMRAIRGIVGDGGLLLIYEPASPDGEPSRRRSQEGSSSTRISSARTFRSSSSASTVSRSPTSTPR